MHGKRIFLGLPKGSLRDKVKESLMRMGGVIVGEASDGLTSLRLMHTLSPDIAILEYQLSGIDGLELAKLCQEEGLSAVVLLSPVQYMDILEKALETWAFEPLIRPFREESLLVAVRTAYRHYLRHKKLYEEVRQLKDSLENRKWMDRAKGYLIEHKGMKEDEAHKKVHKLAMDNRLTIKETAMRILKNQL